MLSWFATEMEDARDQSRPEKTTMTTEQRNAEIVQKVIREQISNPTS